MTGFDYPQEHGSESITKTLEAPNSTMNFLINLKTGTLRSGWQAAIFYGVFFLMASLLLSLTSIINNHLNLSASPEEFSLIALFLDRSGFALAALGASVYCWRLFPLNSFPYSGYALQKFWWRDVGMGLVAGMGLVSAIIITCWITGKAQIRFSHPNGIMVCLAFLQGFVIFLVAASAEELLFRGFPFQTFLQTLHPREALVITSCLFAAIHTGNPNSSQLALFNTALAGVWLGIACYKRGNLWLATGLHTGWNFATVWFWGVPVSGIKKFLPETLLQAQLSGPDWVTGGSYGPEGGLVCTLLLSLTIWWMAMRLKREEMKEREPDKVIPT